MAFGTCSICHVEQAKYKCPKCSVEYCSLACFKNPTHKHEAAESSPEPATATETTLQPSEIDPTQKLFARMAEDEVIQSLLKYKALQVHLAVLLKIVTDSLITKEALLENRREVANLRLCNLRIGGSEENELVEDFVNRVLFLMEHPA